MSLLSHDRYQYDSPIVSKQTWAYPRQHLQQLLWCIVSVRLNLPEVEERKLCPLRYYANCVSTMLTVLILHNVESVYFFYSDPVFPAEYTAYYFRTCLNYYVSFWPISSQWAMASKYIRFLDHTQRRITDGRTPLDEWSARRRDLYLTKHNNHNRQTFMSPVGFVPTI